MPRHRRSRSAPADVIEAVREELARDAPKELESSRNQKHMRSPSDPVNVSDVAKASKAASDIVGTKQRPPSPQSVLGGSGKVVNKLRVWGKKQLATSR